MSPPTARDPDVDLRVPAQRRELVGHRLDVLGVITLGGILGAEARYGASLLWPHGPAEFPAATLGINIVGSGLIGVLMVVITEFVTPHRLARPFLGVGILGGFTTFSTYCTDTLALLKAGRAASALAYLAVTPATAVLAVWVAVVGTRRAGAVARSWRSSPVDTWTEKPS